ncbi:hypothetical protein AMTR_s00062p00108710 [Amborella trichopoda]|uniref:Ubiquitin-like-conjugating enzyme ATG10 n=2 Tax=Amborella trichopoda TaxID=13333 RepID=U5DBL5_AMBTC|nr:hypothetical protein AMTR_s00062p00108710 [Amborella trichopoda]
MASPCDGTLSPTEFKFAAEALMKKWEECKSILHPWIWIPCPKLPFGAPDKAGGYLSLEHIHHFEFKKQQDCIEQKYSEEEVEALDSATLVLSGENETHYYNFHIIYSTSYKVPVLFFRGYHQGGQPLKCDEVEKDLPLYTSKLLEESKWTFITQEEHPYLNCPWFTLHPCGTSEWMRLLLQQRLYSSRPEDLCSHYLVAWFSVVGQVIGLWAPLNLVHCSSSSSSSDTFCSHT